MQDTKAYISRLWYRPTQTYTCHVGWHHKAFETNCIFNWRNTEQIQFARNLSRIDEVLVWKKEENNQMAKLNPGHMLASIDSRMHVSHLSIFLCFWICSRLDILFIYSTHIPFLWRFLLLFINRSSVIWRYGICCMKMFGHQCALPLYIIWFTFFFSLSVMHITQSFIEMHRHRHWNTFESDINFVS